MVNVYNGEIISISCWVLRNFCLERLEMGNLQSKLNHVFISCESFIYTICFVRQRERNFCLNFLRNMKEDVCLLNRRDYQITPVCFWIAFSSSEDCFELPSNVLTCSTIRDKKNLLLETAFQCFSCPLWYWWRFCRAKLVVRASLLLFLLPAVCCWSFFRAEPVI